MFVIQKTKYLLMTTLHVDCLIVDRLHTIYKNTLYKEITVYNNR